MNEANYLLAAELRTQVENLRTRPIPLMQMIPLMQKAADALETHTAEIIFAPQPVPPLLTDEQIDARTSDIHSRLMDHVYEYGTVAEGQQKYVRMIARAVEREVRRQFIKEGEV